MGISVLPGIEGLIFDCDGTLADTMPVHIKAWCDTFADYGIRCPEDFLHAVKGMPAKRIVERFNRLYGHQINPVAFARQKNRRAREKLHESQPIEPVAEIVRQYRGKLPMAVASGGTRENVLLTLESVGLGGCFAAVLTSDDDVLPKPNPDIFIEAARRMNVLPAVCQVFEDGDAGLEAAHRAGMAATDVRPYLQ
jgi:HAD superfamily hydrolase (TIGR01509 family)